MKTKTLTQQVSLAKKIKVRLDFKTMVLLNNLASLEVWKKRYPDAKIVT